MKMTRFQISDEVLQCDIMCDRNKIIILLFVEFWSQLSVINCNQTEGTVSVNTKNGVVNGEQMTVYDKQVNKYLGVPYARKPIGDLRFKKPVAVDNWTEPINATQLPNPCYQIPLTDTFLNANFSEDCLYLNIWQPIGDQNKPKAVIFFIHGRGLVSGSSSEYQFQGQILASKGDVVLVTHNYRVNTLGFLYSGTDDALGNVGLWDNVLALKWVSDNIRCFGGDPNQITIAGQSAGAWAVSIHILSPISRNLYNQAILMSGVIRNPTVVNKTNASNYWLKGAKLIGCANNNDSLFNAQIINCLLNANASALVRVPVLPDMVGNALPGSATLVVIDEVLLPKKPVEMLESGNYKKNLNLMFGTVEDEGQITLSSIAGYGAVAGNFTYNESYANLMNFSSRLPSLTALSYNKINMTTCI